MPLIVEDPEVGRLARALAELRGESIDAVIKAALQQEWRNQQSERPRPPDWIERLRAITHRVAQLPTLDSRPADEILGYDEHGLPS